MLSDGLFFKAEINKKFGLKTSKKWQGAPIIDMPYIIKVIRLYLYQNFEMIFQG